MDYKFQIHLQKMLVKQMNMEIHIQVILCQPLKNMLLNKSINNDIIQKQLEGKYNFHQQLDQLFLPRVMNLFCLKKMNMMMMISDYQLKAYLGEENQLLRHMQLNFSFLWLHIKF
ncbi:unnamed protein product [Paramecium primaurelia]|uniref:Uncharacterized protein n=1 Tax=Paramecium primaurelia TaxID=5886 RepID=A0A8S1MCH2_PARPR|nr:unnamed protein product [Paramecium primaurelia]